jgi:hypothetical protein
MCTAAAVATSGHVHSRNRSSRVSTKVLSCCCSSSLRALFVFVFLAGSSDRASEKRSSSVWSLLLAVVLFSPHFFFLAGSFSSSFPLLFLANAFSNQLVFKVLSPASCISPRGDNDVCFLCKRLVFFRAGKLRNCTSFNCSGVIGQGSNVQRKCSASLPWW